MCRHHPPLADTGKRPLCWHARRRYQPLAERALSARKAAPRVDNRNAKRTRQRSRRVEPPRIHDIQMGRAGFKRRIVTKAFARTTA